MGVGELTYASDVVQGYLAHKKPLEWWLVLYRMMRSNERHPQNLARPHQRAIFSSCTARLAERLAFDCRTTSTSIVPCTPRRM